MPRTHKLVRHWDAAFSSALLTVLFCPSVAFAQTRPSTAPAQNTSSLQSLPHANQIETEPAWTLATNTFNNSFEAQAYVGNGLLGLRVPAAGMGYVGNLGKIGWPLGTERITSAIVAGAYSKVADGTFYKEPKEAFALLPTWSTLTFADSSGTYSPSTATATSISAYHQSLDLRTGVVSTSGIWSSPAGNKSRFVFRVATDRARPHLAVVTLELTPQWSGSLTVSSVLDGNGARRIEQVASASDLAHHTVYVTSKTLGTNIVVAESSTLASSCELPIDRKGSGSSGTAGEDVIFDTKAGATCTYMKYVAVVTSRDSPTPEADARRESQAAAERGLPAFEQENRAAWDTVWNSGIEVEGDPTLQKAIRATQYQLFSSITAASPMSLGPSGLSSDGYAGMVFWDADTWMFPVLLAQHPDIARVMVDYRSNTLPAARKNAANNSYAGAFYPWTSALSGDMGDECYGAVTNAQGRITTDPNKSCTQQFHLQSDIANAQWQYYEATGDKAWLAKRGWPVLEAVAEFWARKATPAPGGGFSITNVQTPDEYATDTDDDAYTNASASLELQAAIQAAGVLGKAVPPAWAQIARGLVKTIPVDPVRKIFLEHKGYAGKQIKQADVVMLTYPLSFPMPQSFGINDLNFYTPVTDVNGPAMTDAIHSIAAATLDAPGCSAFTYTERSYQPFLREPFLNFSEFAPSSNTATAYDFLTGVGGFLQEFLFGFSGFRPLPAAVQLDPSLPPQLTGITLRDLRWQGRTFTLHIGPQDSTVTLISGAALPLLTPSGPRTVQSGKTFMIHTRRSDLQPTDDLARCQKITASSEVPGSPALAAIDGSPATSWLAATPAAMLTVTLKRPSTLGKITVHRGSRDSFPYTAEASTDGITWEVLATASEHPNQPTVGLGTDELAFPPTRAKFVRLNFPGIATAKPPSISDLTITAAKP